MLRGNVPTPGGRNEGAELKARTVINRSHIKSLGAQHPDLVASKTLELRDQEPQIQDRQLSSSTSAPG